MISFLIQPEKEVGWDGRVVGNLTYVALGVGFKCKLCPSFFLLL